MNRTNGKRKKVRTWAPTASMPAGGGLRAERPVSVALIYCDACGIEVGTVHVTVQVELVTTESTRIKVAHVWLCERCEVKNRHLMTQDNGRRERLARAITPKPAWWKDEDLTPSPFPEREGEKTVASGAER